MQRLTHGADWKHIRTEDNPADILSCGIDANHIISRYEWRHEPKWVLESQEKWPELVLELTDIPEPGENIVNLTSSFINTNAWFNKF